MTTCRECGNDIAFVSHKPWCSDYKDSGRRGLPVVDFYPRTFHQIPPQDNPAFGDDECLMIVAENDSLHARTTVLVIDPEDEDDTVTSVAVFWRHDKAVKFCEKCF